MSVDFCFFTTVHYSFKKKLFQELFHLEEKNKQLFELVSRLEKKTEKAKMYLRRNISSAPVYAATSCQNDAVVAKNISMSPSSSSTPSPPSFSPNTFTEEKATASPKADLIHQVNLNLNKNIHPQPSNLSIKPEPSNFLHERAETLSTNLDARYVVRGNTQPASISASLSNANITSITPFLMNANNTSDGANKNNNNAGVIFTGIQGHMNIPFRSPATLKTKHGYFNVNLNYKSPILRPSTLQTVPEVPVSSSGELEEASRMCDDDSPANIGHNSQCEMSTACDLKKVAPTNINLNACNFNQNGNNKTNINLNQSNKNVNLNYANGNFRQCGNIQCDNVLQLHSFQHRNMNDNLNHNTVNGNFRE